MNIKLPEQVISIENVTVKMIRIRQSSSHNESLVNTINIRVWITEYVYGIFKLFRENRQITSQIIFHSAYAFILAERLDYPVNVLLCEHISANKPYQKQNKEKCHQSLFIMVFRL